MFGRRFDRHHHHFHFDCRHPHLCCYRHCLFLVVVVVVVVVVATSSLARVRIQWIETSDSLAVAWCHRTRRGGALYGYHRYHFHPAQYHLDWEHCCHVVVVVVVAVAAAVLVETIPPWPRYEEPPNTARWETTQRWGTLWQRLDRPVGLAFDPVGSVGDRNRFRPWRAGFDRAARIQWSEFVGIEFVGQVAVATYRVSRPSKRRLEIRWE
mmetsp:Transcript_344/g.950  ORF Transcript_344/g.950 Transcript_344/m.950 type:complete len:210 (-) Transcript_344:321-950(-)